MRSVIVDFTLVLTAILLLFFVVDYNDSLRLILPTYDVLRNNLELVVGAIVVLIVIKIVSHEPSIRPR